MDAPCHCAFDYYEKSDTLSWVFFLSYGLIVVEVNTIIQPHFSLSHGRVYPIGLPFIVPSTYNKHILHTLIVQEFLLPWALYL